MHELTIHILPVDEGYQYDIYDVSPDMVSDFSTDSLDGGLCTTTLANALDMARDQAKDLIRRSLIKARVKCNDCRLPMMMKDEYGIVLCGNRRCESFKKHNPA